MKETVLIAGLGEVGYALFELCKETGKFDVYGFDVDKEKMQKINGKRQPPAQIDVMHICYPCTDPQKFARITIDYMNSFKPSLTIIESTVTPGTTRRIYESSKLPIVHSPIRGMHKTLDTMKNDIRFWSKYIGGTTKESADSASRHFKKMGLKVKILRSSVETELAKLFETTYRAWMIASFQEMHRISRCFEADFDDVVDMIEDIHRARLNKPLHFPGVIGGHCLIPNTELLLTVYDSEFLKLILKSNEKRKEEMRDKKISEEVEKVRKREEKLQKDLLKRLNDRTAKSPSHPAN